jgi:hypothetical protein
MRTFLREDWRPWTFLAFVLIFGLFWFALSVNSKAFTKKAEESKRQAAVTQCLHNLPLLENFNHHVHGVNQLADVLVQNSAAVVKATKRNDPQYRTRIANLERLEVAQREIAALKGFDIPTKAQCRKAGA